LESRRRCGHKEAKGGKGSRRIDNREETKRGWRKRIKKGEKGRKKGRKARRKEGRGKERKKKRASLRNWRQEEGGGYGGLRQRMSRPGRQRDQVRREV
jgi:hypothetical protein